MAASKQGGKGKPKTPGSGRTKGTENKRTAEVREQLEALGLDPVEEAVRVYQGKVKFETVVGDSVKKLPAPIDVRMRLLSKLLDKVAPDVKAIELDLGGVTELIVRGGRNYDSN